nr:MAG TPA: hypothetical protein [Caudoviricetes sp.]
MEKSLFLIQLHLNKKLRYCPSGQYFFFFIKKK